ncbi:MAG: adenylate/guanylate cyclase domain-containing protein [Proteobacteria bacterium]|nr:adenylate/guanylate cyclase domain-containing protein [Pseudomonadota bacterium]
MPETPQIQALVFTDVDGSSELWASDRDAMEAAVAIHDALLRRLLVQHGGRELHGVGDALLTVWDDPMAAVRWCAEVQLALVDTEWPTGLTVLPLARDILSPRGERLMHGLRVRMGAHLDRGAGEHPSQEAVRRAARIAGAARGGQVLLSGALWSVVNEQVARDMVATDLGYRRLRGLSGEEHLIQVLPARLAARRFSPVDAVDLRRSNLPPEVTLFVGRENDLAALSELTNFGARLVTVFGSPGIGKTRLAAHFAASRVTELARHGGVWMAAAAEARAPEEVTRAVASALDVPLTVGRTGADATAQIGFALAARGPLLLVIDGLDHVEAASPLPAWLAAAPEARFLVTGRARLGVPGEIAYELAGMSPEAERTAVDLLVARAPRERPDLRTTGSDSVAAASAAHLVRGVPLALELVGAHSASPTWGDLARDLGKWFQAVGAPKDEADALGGALGWIWEHLALWEREVLAQMAVCRGGFDVPAAEKIVDLTAFPAAPWIPDVLGSLCARCLLEDVTLADAPGSPRYRMHRAVRDHVKMRLPRGRRSAAEDRHAAHYLARAESWAVETRGPDALEALGSLERERANLLAVHRRGLLRGGPRGITWALRAVLAMDPLLAWRGPPDTHLQLLDGALASADQSSHAPPLELSTRSLRCRGEVRRVLGRTHEAMADLERARDLAVAAGAKVEEARTCVPIGDHLRLSGRLDEARRMAARAQSLATEAADVATVAAALGLMGAIALSQRDLSRARDLLNDAAELAVQVGDRRVEGKAVGNLGVAARWSGDDEGTEVLYRRAIDIHRQTGDRRIEGVHLGNLGVLLLHRDELDEAVVCFDAALRLASSVGYRRGEAAALTNLALAGMGVDSAEDTERRMSEALLLHEKTADLAGQCLCLSMLGIVAHRRSDETLALERYERAASLADKAGDLATRGVTRLWWSTLLMQRSDPEASDALWADGLHALQEARDPALAGAAAPLALVRRHARGEAGGGLVAELQALKTSGHPGRVAALYAEEVLGSSS